MNYKQGPLWTIEYLGLEQAFETWGISHCDGTRKNQDTGDCILYATVEEFDGDDVFALGQTCKIRKNRYLLTNDTWTGGTVFFVGRVVGTPRNGSADDESICYRLADPWWYLEQRIFQQSWKAWTGSAWTTLTSSHLYLGQDSTGARQTTAEALTEIINYCADPLGNGTETAPILAGTGFPSTNMLVHEVKDITCAEAIRMVLRYCPSAVTSWDFTTWPPTLNIKTRAQSTALEFTIGTKPLAAVQIEKNVKRMVPSVHLKFERTDTEDGANYLTIMHQIAPTGTTGLEFGCLVATINLLGYTRNFRSCQTRLRAIEPDSIAWWKKHVPWLNEVGNAEVVSGTWQVEAGINGLGMEIFEGQFAPWVYEIYPTKTSARGTITADIRFTNGGNMVVETASANITATNMVINRDADTCYVSDLEEYVEGETEPVGLAQSLYDELALAHYDGTITLIEEECLDLIESLAPGTGGMGCVINLAGGRTEWATMRAQIQQVSFDTMTGTTVLTVGPPGHLGATDLVELLRLNRKRWFYNAPATRYTGLVNSSGNQVELGHELADGESSSGASAYQKLTVMSEANNDHKVLIDGTQYKGCVDIGTGNEQIRLRSEDTDAHPIYVQKIDACRVNEDGSTTEGFRMVPCSDFFEEDE